MVFPTLKKQFVIRYLTAALREFSVNPIDSFDFLLQYAFPQEFTLMYFLSPALKAKSISVHSYILFVCFVYVLLLLLCSCVCSIKGWSCVSTMIPC